MDSPKPSKTRHDDGHLVKLQRGRMTKLRPLGPCELFILPEFKDGRMQIRVWGMDGVEIEHFQVPACPKSLSEKD